MMSAGGSWPTTLKLLNGARLRDPSFDTVLTKLIRREIAEMTVCSWISSVYGGGMDRF
jgi:hypothetical protein